MKTSVSKFPFLNLVQILGVWGFRVSSVSVFSTVAGLARALARALARPVARPVASSKRGRAQTETGVCNKRRGIRLQGYGHLSMMRFGVDYSISKIRALRP